MTRSIIIDTDPGVDDALAICLALASPEVDVIGLTTVFGNAATAYTTRNAHVVLAAAGRADVPVARGAERPLAGDYLGPVPQVHGESGLGDVPITDVGSNRPESAATFLADAAAARPGAVTILAVGPLTNLALAVRERPDLAHLVDEVVVMGGNALVPGNATPVAEANINNDPEAADVVFGAEWRVTMVGLDVTHQVNLRGHQIDHLSAGSTPVARLLGAALPHYRDFFERTNGLDGIYVHDPTAVAYLIDPTAFETQGWPLRVETESFSRGKTWPNLGNTDEAAPPAWRHRPKVNVCTGVDEQRVLDIVMSRLAP